VDNPPVLRYYRQNFDSYCRVDSSIQGVNEDEWEGSCPTCASNADNGCTGNEEENDPQEDDGACIEGYNCNSFTYFSYDISDAEDSVVVDFFSCVGGIGGSSIEQEEILEEIEEEEEEEEVNKEGPCSNPVYPQYLYPIYCAQFCGDQIWGYEDDNDRWEYQCVGEDTISWGCNPDFNFFCRSTPDVVQRQPGLEYLPVRKLRRDFSHTM